MKFHLVTQFHDQNVVRPFRQLIGDLATLMGSDVDADFAHDFDRQWIGIATDQAHHATGFDIDRPASLLSVVSCHAFSHG